MSGYEVMGILDAIPPSVKDLGIMVVVLSLVEIAPVKVNPWKWLRSFAELPARFAKLEHEVNDDRAFRWRQMIKSYSRGLERGEKLRDSEWMELLDTVKRYERYCETHPDFRNGYIADCIEYTKEMHRYVMRTGDYAPELKRAEA